MTWTTVLYVTPATDVHGMTCASTRISSLNCMSSTYVRGTESVMVLLLHCHCIGIVLTHQLTVARHIKSRHNAVGTAMAKAVLAAK